jgi:hypothetical protein
MDGRVSIAMSQNCFPKGAKGYSWGQCHASASLGYWRAPANATGVNRACTLCQEGYTGPIISGKVCDVLVFLKVVKTKRHFCCHFSFVVMSVSLF